jgi:hypothetical protein
MEAQFEFNMKTKIESNGMVHDTSAVQWATTSTGLVAKINGVWHSVNAEPYGRELEVRYPLSERDLNESKLKND